MKRASGTKHATEKPIEALVSSKSASDWIAAASDARLTEDFAVALLEHRDLPAAAIEALARNSAAKKNRKALVSLAAHPRSPRHVALPMLRNLFAFELMEVALRPSVPADIKRAADENIVARLAAISPGERMTLAKQGSTRVAAALLRDVEERVSGTALNNPRMTEAEIVNSLRNDRHPAHLVDAICRDSKWSLRVEIQAVLLLSPHISLVNAMKIADRLPFSKVESLMQNSRIQPKIKDYLAARLFTNRLYESGRARE
ncbi:MAG TPA: hypothetical protein VEG32_11330 [Clostridia bacterium]|nr:hypothetical protein [Clostridia bacterium]